MFIVPTIPHLRSLELAIAYRELPCNEAQLRTLTPLQKWKSDPDANRFYGFAPRNKYYVNGQLVREDTPGMSAVSKTPFPEKRVPRRGLQAVSPDDPEYSRLCREQGLDHLLSEAGSPLLPNGVHSSPASAASNLPPRTFSGPTSPSSAHRITTNGNGVLHRPMSPSSDPGAAKPRPLVNGINGTSHQDRN
ncbi:hypothetical protein GE09DRAFT_120791 [Coniochaeta sp. 2T2.1]|nr:hypothetical protein GE09DRAFT_120791 [Coniochaeta sp. 2T2.1]